MKKKVKFTKNWKHIKKGEVKEYSRDISSLFVNTLKVAEYADQKRVTRKKTEEK
jgi:hypothetical protein